MAVISGDILRFTMRQRLHQEAVLNVEFRRYVDIGGSGNTYQELVDEYLLQFTNDVGQIQAGSLLYEGVLVENISNSLDFLDFPFSDTGLNVGVAMPSNVTVTVTQHRATRLTRNGSKRLSGITEAQVTGNAFAAAPAAVADIEAFFGTTLLIGDGTAVNDAELQPVIVGRTPDANGVYQLDLNRVNEVTSASLSSVVSSQNSRKAGRGI